MIREGIDMGKLNQEEELQIINQITEYMERHSIHDTSLITKQMAMDPSLRSWFTSRRHSLQIGSLEDDDILFYRSQCFDFGVKPLLWDEWLDMLKTSLKSLNSNTIGESFCVGTVYQLGKWTRRQIKNFKVLTPERKTLLVESGLYLDYLYGSKSPYRMMIYHGKEKYTNVVEFLKAVNAPLLPFFNDLATSTDQEEILHKYIQDNQGRWISKELQKKYLNSAGSRPNIHHDASNDPKSQAEENNTEIRHTNPENNTEKAKDNTNIKNKADDANVSTQIKPTPEIPRKQYNDSPYKAIDSLMDSIDWKNARSIFQEQLRKREEEEQEAALLMHNSHKETARHKLLSICSGEYLDEFLDSISEEYLTSIATRKVYATISSFDKLKIKKFVGIDKNTTWKLESPVQVLPNGQISGEFYAYIPCQFGWDKIQIKKILLQITIGKRNDSSGGFYCEGEEYLQLGAIEAFNIVDELPEDIGKPFHEHKKNLHRNFIHQKILEIIDEIDYHWEIRSRKKLEELMDLLQSNTLTWKNISHTEAAELGEYLESTFVNIKRVVSEENNELPNVYLISVIDNEPLIPTFTTRLIFTYKSRAYMFYIDQRKNLHFVIKCKLSADDES